MKQGGWGGILVWYIVEGVQGQGSDIYQSKTGRIGEEGLRLDNEVVVNYLQLLRGRT